jgi:AcrR family transcriptional regulator
MPRGISAEHALQRDAILRIAADTFAEVGYPNATMAEISRRCGVSKSLLYHYYESKDAMLHDLSRTYMLRLRELVLGVAPLKLSAKDALTETVRRFVREYETSRTRHIVLLNDVKFLPTEQREEVLLLEREVVQRFADLIEKSYAIDAPKAKVLTMCVFGMINWTFTWLKPDGEISYDQFAETVVGLLESGLNGGAEKLQGFAPGADANGSSSLSRSAGEGGG